MAQWIGAGGKAHRRSHGRCYGEEVQRCPWRRDQASRCGCGRYRPLDSRRHGSRSTATAPDLGRYLRPRRRRHVRRGAEAALGTVTSRPTSSNRIRMATNCLLVESGRELVLVDTGIGDKVDARFRDIYAMDRRRARGCPTRSRDAGYEPGDVTHVLLTHLHFDHCGWSTRRVHGAPGADLPARPLLARARRGRARAVAQRARPRELRPAQLGAAVRGRRGGAVRRRGGDRRRRARGEGAGTQRRHVRGDARRRRRRARLSSGPTSCPTAAHVPYPWIMGYDLYPLTTLENKKRWLPRAAAEELALRLRARPARRRSRGSSRRVRAADCGRDPSRRADRVAARAANGRSRATRRRREAMATEVVMPQMGESIAEGTITKWLVKVGEKVERDQPLFEISTDKVDAEIPSPAAGVLLEIRHQAGETVAVQKVVAMIGEAGEKPAAAASPAAAGVSRLPPPRHRPRRAAPAPAPKPPGDRSAAAPAPAAKAAPAPAPRPECRQPAAPQGQVRLRPGDRRQRPGRLRRRHPRRPARAEGRGASRRTRSSAAPACTAAASRPRRCCTPPRCSTRSAHADELRHRRRRADARHRQGARLQARASSTRTPRASSSCSRRTRSTGIRGRGRLTGPQRGRGHRRRRREAHALDAATCMIATGSVPREIPIAPADGKRDRQLRPHPRAGAGAASRSSCSAPARWAPSSPRSSRSFGSEVTLVEMLPRILPIEDEEVSAELERRCKQARHQGADRHQARPSVEKTGDRRPAGARARAARTSTLEAEMLLVAVGRAPVTEDLGLEALGIELERGYVKVNGVHADRGAARLRHRRRGATRRGWRTSPRPRASSRSSTWPGKHGAADQLRPRARRCTYCEPEVGERRPHRGEGEGARLRRRRSASSRFIGARQGARSSARPQGFVKIVREKKYDEVLGVHIIGPHATDLIAEACVGAAARGDGRGAVPHHPRPPDALGGGDGGGARRARPRHPLLSGAVADAREDRGAAAIEPASRIRHPSSSVLHPETAAPRERLAKTALGRERQLELYRWLKLNRHGRGPADQPLPPGQGGRRPLLVARAGGDLGRERLRPRAAATSSGR